MGKYSELPERSGYSQVTLDATTLEFAMRKRLEAQAALFAEHRG